MFFGGWEVNKFVMLSPSRYSKRDMQRTVRHTELRFGSSSCRLWLKLGGEVNEVFKESRCTRVV